MKDVFELFLEEKETEITIFLKTLFSQADGFIEIRKLGNTPKQWFVPINHLGFAYVDELIKEESIDMYFGVHPRKNDQGDSSAVEKCFVLFADFDVKPIEVPVDHSNEESPNGYLSWYYFKDGKYYHIKRPPYSTIVTQLEAHKLTPSIIVDSGRGYHMYWLLPKEVSPEDWKTLQSHLFLFLKNNLKLPTEIEIDTKLKDLPRVLRLPNTINSKTHRTAKIISLTDKALTDYQINKILAYEHEENDLFEQLAFNALKPHWKEGQRNELTFYFAGFCRKNNVPIDVCKNVITKLQLEFGDDKKDWHNRYRRIEETYIKNNVKGYTGLLELGIDLKELTNMAQAKFETPLKKNTISKLQKYFIAFQNVFSNIIYKTPSNTDGRGILYLWNGKYFEALYYTNFTPLFLNFVQENLNEITTETTANNIYDNLYASTKINVLPDWKPVIAFNNCVFNLNTYNVESHRPEFGNRFFVNANFLPDLFFEAINQPTWLKRFHFVIKQMPAFKQYIETLEINEILLTQLIEVGGYIMLPRIKRFNLETAFILYGSGANGKSTFLALLQELFNGFYSAVSLSDLEGFNLASLIGKYLNIANEITEKHDKTIAVENLKRTVSWDKMEIPIKFRPHITAELPIIHIFAVNSNPRTEETNNAVFRRLCFLHFEKSLQQSQRDPAIIEKLINEKDLFATLFTLGALKVLEQKYITNNEEIANEVITANNPVVQWLYEHFEPAENYKNDPYLYVHSLADLRKDFNEWYGKTKFHNIDTFSSAIRQAIEFLAANDSKNWQIVKIIKDTKYTPLINNPRKLNIVFPLKRTSI